jgi:hypothetical protein
MRADIAARVPEIGRHPPEAVRRLFIKHQDRIFFATDFQVYQKLILGSSGDAERPTDDDAVAFFEKHWRWFETNDRDFPHMTPIQGEWTISAIGLPPEVLRKIYFDNARQLLARSLPAPVLKARRVRGASESLPDPTATWTQAAPVWLDQDSSDGQAKPSLATEVRALWNDAFLFLEYRAPYTQLTSFDPPDLEKERIGLWERDVVETFIGSDFQDFNRYCEFQVAPNGMKLDLKLQLPDRDFDWSSGFHTTARVDEARHVWIATMAIPLRAIASETPVPGTHWRINLYRCDYANKGFRAWRPTLKETFHTPERFGILEFAD